MTQPPILVHSESLVVVVVVVVVAFLSLNTWGVIQHVHPHPYILYRYSPYIGREDCMCDPSILMTPAM